MCLALGCDMYKGYCKGIGPPTFHKIMKGFDLKGTRLNEDSIKLTPKKLGTKISIVNAYLDSMMHNPENEIPIDTNSID